MTAETSHTHRFVAEPSDPIRVVVGRDLEQLIRRTIDLPEASHFVACGQKSLGTWFHPAARTREQPVVDIGELLGRTGGGKEVVVAGRLDSIVREAVARFLIKSTCKPGWPGAVLWYWGVCSDTEILVWFDDWPWYVRVNRRLEDWAESMMRDGLIEQGAPPA